MTLTEDGSIDNPQIDSRRSARPDRSHLRHHYARNDFVLTKAGFGEVSNGLWQD